MDSAPNISTLGVLFSAGFTLLGDSRDFTNSSIQLTFGRGQERLTWTFPMQKAIVNLDSAAGGVILNASAEQLSFDVMIANRAPVSALPEDTNSNGV